MKKIGILMPAGLLCLAAAGLMHRSLLIRREAFRPPHETDLRSVPPLVAFTTVAVGGFRGILADLLWLRVSALQEEGKFFEITQLSDWITKLEPTFAEVWGFHAWNMAYNISVMFDRSSDRWRWVEKGVRLLRDDGIRYNPADPRLYWELGWLFHHKIAGFTDRASGHYQFRLFRDVEAVLPGGFLASAGPGVAGRLRETFRMDSAVMAAMDGAIGPLDWRLPESHALYWAWVGRDRCAAGSDLLLERLFYQSMVETAFRGGLVFSPERQVLVRTVRPDLFNRTLAVLDESRRRFPDDTGIQTAADFFLRDAIVQLYARGRDADAARFLDRYRALHPDNKTELAPFVEQEIHSGLTARPGFLELEESLYFEAARERLKGRTEIAERLDRVADATYEAVARRLAGEGGGALPFGREEIRRKGRAQAAEMADLPGEKTP